MVKVYRRKRISTRFVRAKRSDIMRKRRMGIRRGRMGGPAQPVQYFKRTLYMKANRVSSTAADTFAGVQFTLNDVPNVAEFTSLYDQYQIKGIKYSLIPRISETDPAQQSLPNIGSVIDQDDASAPTSIDQLTQYQNFRLTRGNKVHSRYWKPAIAQEVFGGGVLTAYAPRKNVWIDCNSAAVPQYGIKFFIQQTAVVITFDVKIDYYIAFKNVR